MSLKRNIIANYAGQAYNIGIGIVITPLYLGYLGAEPYGLVGIFALMQAWMSLLDVGISPTLGRQAAVMRGQAGSEASFWALLKSFEALFMCLAVIMVGCIFMVSYWLAQHWLNVKTLELNTVITCLRLMGIMIGLRWFSSLYRSGINGLEDQVWLNSYNVIVISIKYIGALVLVAIVSNDIVYFFIYQLVIGCLELCVLMWRLYSRLAKPTELRYFCFDWSVVRSVSPYAMGIAYTSGIWILITQTDKLILSSVLPLEEYGYFTLVALMAGGIMLVSSPIAQALTPRMTYLYAKGEHEKMVQLYRDSCQMTALVVLCAASMVGNYAQPLLYAWTGDKAAAAWGAEVLFWFAYGNAILAICAYPYYMQKAMGKLKWHVYGSTLMAVLQIPIIYFSATRYGAVGAGIAWICFLGWWFVLWMPFVHNKISPGMHYNWMRYDIFPVFATIAVLLFLIQKFDIVGGCVSRSNVLIVIFLTGLVLLLVSSISTRFVRSKIIKLGGVDGKYKN